MVSLHQKQLVEGHDSHSCSERVGFPMSNHTEGQCTLKLKADLSKTLNFKGNSESQFDAPFSWVGPYIIGNELVAISADLMHPLSV